VASKGYVTPAMVDQVAARYPALYGDAGVPRYDWALALADLGHILRSNTPYSGISLHSSGF
jgi:hypothetical protein